MRSNGRVQTKTALLERVWNMSFDPTTGVVETHISRLRQDRKPFGDKLIINRRGSGYVFVPAMRSCASPCGTLALLLLFCTISLAAWGGRIG